MLVAILTLPVGALAEPETRVPVPLPEDDRQHLLDEMRAFLVYTTATLAAAIEGDMMEVQRLAEQVRPPLERARILATDAPSPAPPMPNQNSARAPTVEQRHSPNRFERMRRNLPQPFRAMMLEMREAIAGVGRDAVAYNDPLHSLRQLHRVQLVCVACHQVYRLEAGHPDTGSEPVAGPGRPRDGSSTDVDARSGG
jgi:hypothetical protein